MTWEHQRKTITKDRNQLLLEATQCGAHKRRLRNSVICRFRRDDADKLSELLNNEIQKQFPGFDRCASRLANLGKLLGRFSRMDEANSEIAGREA